MVELAMFCLACAAWPQIFSLFPPSKVKAVTNLTAHNWSANLYITLYIRTDTHIVALLYLTCLTQSHP